MPLSTVSCSGPGRTQLGRPRAGWLGRLFDDRADRDGADRRCGGAGLAVGGPPGGATGAFLGGLAGSVVFGSYPQNLGDVEDGLHEELADELKTGAIDQDTVDGAALAAASPMAAIDKVGLWSFGALKGVSTAAKNAFR